MRRLRVVINGTDNIGFLGLIMIRADAVKRVQQLLGFRTDLQEDIEIALRQAQEKAENGSMHFLPWFLRKDFTATIQPADTDVLLPQDFIREYEHDVDAVFVSGLGPIKRVPHISSEGQGSMIGGFSYAIKYDADEEASILTFWPRFSQEAVLTISYYAEARILDGDIENSWLKYASQYIIGLAGEVIAEGLKDMKAVERFLNEQSEGRSAILVQDAAYRSGTHKPQFGGVEDRRESYRDPSLRFNDIDLGD